jgi:hypothetical protein
MTASSSTEWIYSRHNLSADLGAAPATMYAANMVAGLWMTQVNLLDSFFDSGIIDTADSFDALLGEELRWLSNADLQSI